MKKLEEYIKANGQIISDDILKVDNFLNQLVDVNLLADMAHTWYEEFKNQGVNKILTIEASGIAIATMVASVFKVPLLFAKKSKTTNMSNNLYQAKVFSFTHQKENVIVVDKSYLTKEDKILIIDDFLANGQAVLGLMELARQAGANVIGVGIAIEKGFQKAGDMLRSKGFNIKSLAIIDKMDPSSKEIIFR